MLDEVHDSGREIRTGECRGGPMAGEQGESRFPVGFLLVDKQANRVWIYDYVEAPNGSVFQVRSEEGEELVSDPAAPKNRFRAAEEPHYDVRAWGGGSR